MCTQQPLQDMLQVLKAYTYTTHIAGLESFARKLYTHGLLHADL